MTALAIACALPAAPLLRGHAAPNTTGSHVAAPPPATAGTHGGTKGVPGVGDLDNLQGDLADLIRRILSKTQQGPSALQLHCCIHDVARELKRLQERYGSEALGEAFLRVVNRTIGKQRGKQRGNPARVVAVHLIAKGALEQLFTTSLMAGVKRKTFTPREITKGPRKPLTSAESEAKCRRIDEKNQAGRRGRLPTHVVRGGPRH